MKYTREISDPMMIQYIILYTLCESKRILTHNQLTSIVLDQCNIPFTDFAIALDHLINIGFITRYKPEKTVYTYELTDKGIEANEFFSHSIPIYIREDISQYIAPFFHEEVLKNSISAEILPINEHEFMVSCTVLDKKTPLMELNFYAGTRQTAAAMARNFKKHNEEIYQKIAEALTPSDEEDFQDELQ